MAFKITARTLLELGAELIGSDAVALYELAKNSVDASSPVVRIRVQSVLPYSRFRHALDLVDEGEMPLAEIRQNIEQWVLPDAPAGVARPLLTALTGAKNASAFRRLLTEGYRDINFVEVGDDGDGMSFQDLEEIFLTIGTRSRREEKSRWSDRDDDPSRTLLGDKGVGRLSAMRLGDHLAVRSSKAGESRWNDLAIDWTRFSHDSDALLEDIAVAPELGPRKEDPDAHGTTIRVSQLKGDWTRFKFGAMLNAEFSRMVDPFDRRRGNRLFRITYNDQQVTLPQIPQRLFDLAHAKVAARFEYLADRQAQLVLEMEYRLNTHKKLVVTLPEVRLVSVTQSRSTRVLRRLGPFKVEFLWFNRLFLTAVEGLGTKSDVQDMVRQWAGGLMVFRDGFRINPYGGGDDDWLQLDKRAFGRRGYKLNRQQVIGRVNLTWRNKRLIEQTNREGLVDNEYKEALVSILQKVLEDFKTFSQNIEDELKQEDLTSVDVLKARVSKSKTEIQRRIREIAVDAPEQAGPLKEVERLVKALASQIDDVDTIIDDYKDERRKFVHLAGLGLMVELILHELGRSSSNTLSTLEGVDKSQLAGTLPAVFQTLESQLRTLQKRIETLDPLSTSRRQTKESFTVEDLVQQVVDARDAQAKRHKVTVTISSISKQPWRIKAVRGMLIQILENLLSNSFYWLKQQAVIEPKLKPRILIEIDQAAGTIEISDNGPGIDAAEANEIFKPFVTAKPPGEGNGLGLYIARELAEYHDWTLDLVGPPGYSGMAALFAWPHREGQVSDNLEQAAKVGGVELLAIVDDAYDPPRGEEISEDAFNRFVQSLEDDRQRITALEAATTFVEDDLDDWETFAAKPELIENLWNLSVGVAAHGAMTDGVVLSLEILFSDVNQDRISKLQQLKPLEKLLAATNVRVMKLGADPEPSVVAKANVVFLDLFLSADVPSNPLPGEMPRTVLDRARERAVRYLEDVRRETQDDVTAVPPAFILISSLGTQQVAQNFRRRTSQTASRFRFVQKQALERGDPHDLLAIAEILRTCRASALFEPLRKVLPIVIAEAHDWVAQRLVDLDIADFARLYELSLQAEGQMIEDYIKEVVAGAVSERIMCSFTKHAPTRDRPNPFEDVPSRFVEAPSNAMAELYSATRMTIDRGYRGPDDSMPVSGDLFLEGTLPKRASTSLVGRSITAVMTPICDLMSRNGGEPAATSVLMLQGTLRPTYYNHKLDPQIVILNGRFYEVDWGMKHPQALPLKELRKDVRQKKRIWLGRLKAEHFLALQSEYLSSFARVGLLKAPALFEPLAGKVCVREGGNLIELDEGFDLKSGFAFQSPQRGKDATKQPVFFTGAFLEHLRGVLQRTAESGERHADTRAKARGLLERMDQLVMLVTRRPPTSQGINDYLKVELLPQRGAAVSAAPNHLIMIVLKA